jgi:hypothetical protein
MLSNDQKQQGKQRGVLKTKSIQIEARIIDEL